MNLTPLTTILNGSDAPFVETSDDVMTLRYASLSAYEARVHADHAALASVPWLRVVDATMPHVAAHLGYVVLVLRFAEAPIAPSPSRKSR